MAEPLVLRAELGERSYSVWVAEGTGALGRAAQEALGQPRPASLLADAAVLPLHGARFRAALEGAGFAPLTSIEIAGGEASKRLPTVEAVCERLASVGHERSHPIFALGGGVTGDIAGFVAATFLRGVPVVQLPTTLLAQVDSALGGKTGVNLAAGKNLVGAFWQPRLVYSDTTTLETLPERERAAGWAEVVKYGFIADARILDRLEAGPPSRAAVTELVARASEIKLAIVSRDERESAERALLNFGHTVGHAIEAATGYAQLLHGEAVALGMVAALRVSAALGGDPSLEPRGVRLLAGLGLPTEVDRYLTPAVLSHLAVDKKRAGGRIRFVVCERAGHARTQLMERSEIEGFLLKGKAT